MPAKSKLLLETGALGIFLVAWLSPRAVPIYDGIGAPDEPYRYVSPPPGSKPTAAPTPARAQLTPGDLNTDGGLSIASLETGPQVNVILSQGSISLPPKTTNIQVLARPLAPAVQPAGGKIEGNIYELTITADGKPAAVNLRSAAHNRLIDLRLPQGFAPLPAMIYKPGGGKWQKLDTDRVGNDIYESSLQGTGDYALARFGVNDTNGGGVAAIIAPLAALGMVAVIIAVIRISSSAKSKNQSQPK